MIYETFMVSSNLWADLGVLSFDCQIFLEGTELQFTGILVQLIGDYFQ